ncbi:PGPGW domain-containing protein [Bryobacter aggregatus]|uniref:PGPGW domain-containing protein n=1 Tax=Bryobacter aggregatus TaxID=360054 RepID=UPI0012BAF406|nr:PGPGW domain-containing protein [Bryobacter aggregatus]
MKKFLRYLMGIGLVILGIIGLILPIMPGWIFLIPGLMILAEEFPWLDRFLKKWIAWAKAKAAREKAPVQKEESETKPPAV